MRMLLGILGGLVLIATVEGVAAADLARGIDAFERGDDDTARVELTPLAQAGDPEAQYVLGFMHALGRGVPADLVQAHVWFNLAATGGKHGAASARERLAGRMTPQQIALAQQRAMDFFPTSAPASGSRGSASSSWSQPPATPAPTGRALIRAIQQELAGLGYQPGPADGLMGRRTREAIAAFQRQRGLAVDSQPSAALLTDIRSAAEQGMRARTPPRASSPPPTADAGGWYLQRPKSATLDEVLVRLRGLLQRDDVALRRGVQRLVGSGDWPWDRLVFRDRFDRPAGQGGLDWRVMSGEFAIAGGLVSEAPAAAAPGGRERSAEEQIIGNLLGALLGGGQGRAGAPAAPRQGGTAVIRLAIQTGTPFLLRARIMPEQVGRGMQLLLASADGDSLRLRYDDAAGRMDLLHDDAGGTRSLSSVPLRFTPGRDHRIEWWSRRGDDLGVAVDGRSVIENARVPALGGLRRFEWHNDGGRYRLGGVELHTRSNS